MTTDARTHRRDPLAAARRLLLDRFNGRWHARALAAYLLLVALHFGEHLLQLAQVRLLGIAPADAGGLLGGVVPGLAANEVLHSSYNSFQLAGLILLLPGFRRARRARAWWLAALVFQSWHWLEHAFLQAQVISGVYFWGAIKQMSVLERFFPRVDLHFAYNLSVVIPTLVAVALYLRWRSRPR